jgi:hypothetical protein
MSHLPYRVFEVSGNSSVLRSPDKHKSRREQRHRSRHPSSLIMGNAQWGCTSRPTGSRVMSLEIQLGLLSSAVLHRSGPTRDPLLCAPGAPGLSHTDRYLCTHFGLVSVWRGRDSQHHRPREHLPISQPLVHPAAPGWHRKPLCPGVDRTPGTIMMCRCCWHGSLIIRSTWKSIAMCTSVGEIRGLPCNASRSPGD